MNDGSDPRENHAGPGELQCLWIEDEGLLRDEGVVFGLARNAESLQEKEAAIRAYHVRFVAEGNRRRAALEAALAALREQHARDEAAAVQAPAPVADQSDPDAHPAGGLVVRYALGAAAGAVACAGTAFLVYEQLRPSFQHPWIVTAGVVGAGFFTASLPVPLLFVGDGARRAGGVELWKVRLAELGVPLAAAAFVVAWSLDRLGPVRAAATATLLFMAFAFAGRQVLSTVPPLGAAVRALRRERILRLEQARERARWLEPGGPSDAVAALRRELADLRSPEEWEAICETRLAIFRSEYHLGAARAGQAVPRPRTQATLLSATGSH
jgi:hypothetical protein